MNDVEAQARKRNEDRIKAEAMAEEASAASATAALSPKLQLCLQVLRGIMRRRESQAAFNEPVDPVERDIPHYHLVVKRPMDLGTVKQRLMAGYYNTDAVKAEDDVDTDGPATYDWLSVLSERCECAGICVTVSISCRRGKGEAGFVSDVRLVFANAELYAQPESAVYKMVRSAIACFRSLIAGWLVPSLCCGGLCGRPRSCVASSSPTIAAWWVTCQT